MSNPHIVRASGVQDVNDRRDVITRLYWDEDRDLPEVMDIMEFQYRFKATERQYKGAFKRWNLQKNATGADMKHIMRIRKRRREEDGKDTQFSLCKRRVPDEKIDRWVQRSGFETRLTISGLPSMGETPPSLDYKTPSEYNSLPGTPLDQGGHDSTGSDAPVHAAFELGEMATLDLNGSPDPTTPRATSQHAHLSSHGNTTPLFIESEGSSMWSEPIEEQQLQQQPPRQQQEERDSIDRQQEVSFCISDPGDIEEIDTSEIYRSDDNDESLQVIRKEVFEQDVKSTISRISTAFDMETMGRHLRAAASRGDRLTVKKILTSHCHCVDSRSPAGRTALCNAAFVGHCEIVKDLLYAGADMQLSLKDLVEDENTPMRLAIVANQVACVDALISFYLGKSSDAGPSSAFGLRLTELCMMWERLDCLEIFVQHSLQLGNAWWDGVVSFAVAHFHFEALRILLKYGVNIVQYDRDLLHRTIKSKNPLALDMVKFLLECGLDVNQRDALGDTPLQYTLKYWPDQLEICRLLIKADANLRSRHYFEDAPIHIAIHSGDIPAVSLLLERGANPNQQRNNGRAPLHDAVCLDDPSLMVLLLRHGADADRRDELGSTPLHLTQRGRTIEILLTAGADPNILDNNGKTALHYAVESDSLEQVNALLCHKRVNPNLQDRRGDGPLHRAVESANFSNHIPVLIQAGANPNLENSQKETPLHCAVRLHATEPAILKKIMQLLIQASANLDLQDTRGKTPLHYAAMTLEPEPFRFLVLAGATLDIQDNKGWTPLHEIMASLAGEILTSSAFHLFPISQEIPNKVQEVIEILRQLPDPIPYVNTTNFLGQTPLHLLFWCQSFQLVTRDLIAEVESMAAMFVEKGASLDMTDKEGKTPMHYASLNYSLDLRQYLKKPESDPSITSYHDITA